MKPRSSIKAVMSVTGLALALTSSSAMAAAALSKTTVRKIANQEITKRAAGLVGPTGPAGGVGTPGSAGPAGAVGVPGPTGATGAAGAAGALGPAGPAGSTGPAGAVGAQGPVGQTGPKGLIGATGAVGPQGSVGPKGLPGAIGLPGDPGPAGPAGPTGPTGSAAVQRYVHVKFNGDVDAPRSLGVAQANVTIQGDNMYCFGGLSLVKGGQVSVDYGDVDFTTETAQFGFSSSPGCESFVVISDNLGNQVLGGFFLILY